MATLHGTTRVFAAPMSLLRVPHPGPAPAATPLMGFRSLLPASRRTTRKVVRRVTSEHQEAAAPQLQALNQVGVPRKMIVVTGLCQLSPTQDADDDQAPYLDGFLRSFLLGLAMGGVFETLHVLIKVRLLAAQ